MKSPSPSPISAIENSPVVQDHVEEGVDEVSDNLGLDGDTYFKDQDDDVSPESQRRNLSDAREAVTAAEAALTWARRGEAAAQAEADAERKLAAARALRLLPLHHPSRMFAPSWSGPCDCHHRSEQARRHRRRR